jgi:alpha 1,3-glucosidase
MVHDPYTLVVALDSKGAARGMLYLDDGRTYRYKEGAFSVRSFTFENNKLVNAAQAPSKAVALPDKSKRFCRLVVMMIVLTLPCDECACLFLF